MNGTKTKTIKWEETGTKVDVYPTIEQVARLNKRIAKLEKPRFKSGYLISKFGK